MIGDLTPAEWVARGENGVQLTTAGSNSYPLYYFVPSVTGDGRYLVVHSERDGTVQLYRVDLETGEMGRLTDGATWDSGWAVWCLWRLRGIFNHLSALNPVRDEVFYFQDDELRATKVHTFENRLVGRLAEGRMPIAQSAFSPDGSTFAYVHADAQEYVRRLREREVAENVGSFDWDRDHHSWFRNGLETTLTVVDCDSGESRDVITTDFHFHHVLFVDDDTILVNHPRDTAGMWVVSLSDGEVRHWRPESAPGANDAWVNHQVVTERGIHYEAVSFADGHRRNFLGCFDPATGAFAEAELPVGGYVHVGYDPTGQFAFIEHADGEVHEILAVHKAEDGDDLAVTPLQRLTSPFREEQRSHAHPFLTPDSRLLFYTDWDENGFSQVCMLRMPELSMTHWSSVTVSATTRLRPLTLLTSRP